MATCLFGPCLTKAKIFQGAELRGRCGGTPKSGDLAGVAGVPAEYIQRREGVTEVEV